MHQSSYDTNIFVFVLRPEQPLFWASSVTDRLGNWWIFCDQWVDEGEAPPFTFLGRLVLAVLIGAGSPGAPWRHLTLHRAGNVAHLGGVWGGTQTQVAVHWSHSCGGGQTVSQLTFSSGLWCCTFRWKNVLLLKESNYCQLYWNIQNTFDNLDKN